MQRNGHVYDAMTIPYKAGDGPRGRRQLFPAAYQERNGN